MDRLVGKLAVPTNVTMALASICCGTPDGARWSKMLHFWLFHLARDGCFHLWYSHSGLQEWIVEQCALHWRAALPEDRVLVLDSIGIPWEAYSIGGGTRRGNDNRFEDTPRLPLKSHLPSLSRALNAAIRKQKMALVGSADSYLAMATTTSIVVGDDSSCSMMDIDSMDVESDSTSSSEASRDASFALHSSESYLDIDSQRLSKRPRRH